MSEGDQSGQKVKKITVCVTGEYDENTKEITGGDDVKITVGDETVKTVDEALNALNPDAADSDGSGDNTKAGEENTKAGKENPKAKKNDDEQDGEEKPDTKKEPEKEPEKEDGEDAAKANKGTPTLLTALDPKEQSAPPSPTAAAAAAPLSGPAAGPGATGEIADVGGGGRTRAKRRRPKRTGTKKKKRTKRQKKKGRKTKKY